jgi:hypothetical protein
MERKPLTNREDFEFWLFDMDDALERFLAALPPSVRTQLDGSPQSLDALEGWILERYPSTEAMLKPDQSRIVDGAARYIGETYRRVIGGRWDIQFHDPKMAFFATPILTDYEERSTPMSPLALATASADRRTGNFLRTVLENNTNRAVRSSTE